MRSNQNQFSYKLCGGSLHFKCFYLKIIIFVTIAIKLTQNYWKNSSKTSNYSFMLEGAPTTNYILVKFVETISACK